MNNIINLIKILKSKEFVHKTEELYKFLNSDKKVSFEEYLSAIRGTFIDRYIAATDEDDMTYIINAAKKNDISAIDAEEVLKKLKATKSKTGELIAKDYIEKTIDEMSEYQYETIYDDLSKYNGFISSTIKKYNPYYDIKKIKSGDYIGPVNYRLSESEIKKIELVKPIGPLNRVIHDLYDVEGALIPYCEYEDIPEDSILNRFAFHTDETNPPFKIIFEDGIIVEYVFGDLRVLSYQYQDMLTLTKLYMTQELVNNEIFDITSVPKEDFIMLIRFSTNKSLAILNTLEMVYTKRMIDDSKKEMEGIKELVKEYNL